MSAQDHFEPGVDDVLAALGGKRGTVIENIIAISAVSAAISLKRIADELCGGVRRPYETTERASLTDILSCAADRMQSQ